MATYVLNWGEVMVSIDEEGVVQPSTNQGMGLGTITNLGPFPSIFLYNVGDTVAYMSKEATFFRDSEDGVSYAIMKESAIRFSYEPLP